MHRSSVVSEKGTQRLDALDQFGQGGLASEIFRFPLEP